MFKLFKHYIPYAVLLLAMLDFVLLFAAGEFGWMWRAHQIGMEVDDWTTRLLPLFTFALSVQISLIAVGVYSAESLSSLRLALPRLLVGVALGIILLAIFAFILPGSTLWRSVSLYAMGIAYAVLFGVRALLGSALGGLAFKRRLVIMGAGQRALRITKLADDKGAGFVIVGHIDMNDCEKVIPTAINRYNIESLTDFVEKLNASEVIVALEERRNALPLADLVRLRTTGVHVNEVSTFIERETGRIDLRSVNPSWLIYSDGFSSGRRISSWAKRVFDIAASLALLIIALPLIILGAIAVKLDSKGPAFFRQTRVGLYGANFDLIKLRSMRTDAEANGAVWAQKDDPRVTKIGKFIRLTRIDELPQIWSVLRGDMSFVGPRPERPEFVTGLEEKLTYYAERHMVKPGITGWAQINYPYGASLQDARAKLEYDLYYAKNYTPFLDILILLQTLRVVLWADGAR